MSAASPEFFKPAAPAFSPLPLVFGAGDDVYDCKTPAGSMIPYLSEPTTCPPPAPRKKKPTPPPSSCRKRLFESSQPPRAAAESSSVPVPVISLSLDELERLFRPLPPPPATTTTTDKRRRSVSASANKNCAA